MDAEIKAHGESQPTEHEAQNMNHLNLENIISHYFTLSKWCVFFQCYFSKDLQWIATSPPSHSRKMGVLGTTCENLHRLRESAMVVVATVATLATT